VTAGGKRYLSWLAAQPCIKCGANGVELAHVRGCLSRKTGLVLPRRKNEAAMYALPICPADHRLAADSIHAIGEREWFDRLGHSADRLVASHFARFFWDGGR
jgi:hypothetical protein